MTVIITVAGGKCASSKTASGGFRMLQREPKTHCPDKMLFLQKDVLGKGFSSNSWKAIYSTGRKAETLNLAVGGKKQLSLENCMEKEQEEI